MFIIMYYLLDLNIAAIAVSIVVFRNMVSIVLNDTQNKYCVIALTTLASAIILSNMTHMADLIVLAANIAVGSACLMRNHFVQFRLLMSLSQILWICHSLIFGVYAMIFSCVVILITNAYALFIYTGAKDTAMAWLRENLGQRTSAPNNIS